MYKKIALIAMAAVAVSSFAQTSTTTTTTTTTNSGDWSWRQKYSTYNMSNVDVNTMDKMGMWKSLDWQLSRISGADRFTIERFLDQIPGDQEIVVLKALENNFKQASMIRDEVAQAQFGTPTTYAWLSYPPLAWSDTPGQNSWTSITMTDGPAMTSTTTTTTTTYTDDSYNSAIAMTSDSSRPMRMVMAHRGWRDINYDQALDILGANLDETERGVLHEVFMPKLNEPTISYTNGAALDSIIHLINANACMADHLDRYTWYNHFNNQGNWSW